MSGTGLPQPLRLAVEVNGQPQPALSNSLVRLSAVENATGVHRCEAVFTNWGPVGRKNVGFLHFDRRLLDFGMRVVVKLPTGTIMDGVITAICANYPASTPPEMSIVVDDRYRDLRLVPRTRTFENMTDSDIAQRIARDNGLLTTSIDLDGPTYKVVAQLNQTDLAFLRVRARLCDAELRLRDQQLSLKSRSRSGAEALHLAFGQALTNFTVIADTATQPTRVTATAWDVENKSTATATVNDSILGAQLGRGSSGSQTVAQSFGQRPVSVALSPLDPHVHAESAFRTEAQRFVIGHGATQADARIAVGTMIRLSGLGPLFSGLYYVSEVNHTFDGQSGAVTKFAVESPALGQTQ